MLSDQFLAGLLDVVEALLQEGRRLTVFVSDVAVLTPENFTKPMVDNAAT